MAVFEQILLYFIIDNIRGDFAKFDNIWQLVDIIGRSCRDIGMYFVRFRMVAGIPRKSS